MVLQEGQKLVIIGDSVTDVGRAQPIGEGLFDALGHGYPALVKAFLEAAYPERRLHVVNMGTSGNNVRNLAARWQTDVIDLKPDWLTILIGINDVWRQFDLPGIPAQHVYLDEYEKTLDALIVRTLPLVKGIVLMTPWYMEPNPADPMRAQMDKYGAVVKKLAEKHHTRFLDTQAIWNDYFTKTHSTFIAWDRVHPNLTGHMLIARALLKTLEFESESANS